MFRGACPIRALWIWGEGAPEKNAYVYFRKEFDLKSVPEKAELSIFVCDRYLLFLNGQAVKRGPAVGTDNTRFYDVIDVTQYLKSGRNVVGVIAYNYGPGTRNRIFKGPGALIARIAVTYKDATIGEVSTDSSWKSLIPASRNQKAPKINDWDVGYCEVFDTTAEPTGWMLAGFDDGLWKHALLLPSGTASNYGELVPRPLANLTYALVPPQKCVLSDAGGGRIKGANTLAGKSKGGTAIFDASTGSSRPFAVYDFGRIMSGRVRLHLFMKQAGGHVDISYGESRDLTPMDAIVLPDKEIVWSSFGTRSFRYVGVAVMGNPAPVRLVSIEAEEEIFPFGEEPAAKGDAGVQAIVKAAVNTLKASSRDYFVDCPGREQALWLGDVRIEALAAYNGFGDKELTRHSVELFTLMQGRDGSIPAVGPLSGDAFIPDYHVQWPTIAHDYYMHTGDKEALSRWQVALSKAVSWMERELDRRSLIPRANRPGWWCFLDWANYLPREDYSGILNIFAYEGFLSASRLARVLGEEGLASRWLSHAENMRLGIYDNLYDSGTGMFLDIPKQSGIESHSRQVNALAVSSGLVEGKDAYKVMEQMLKRRDIPPIQTPYFAWHYLEALLKAGFVSQAMSYVKEYWGGMLDRGADCFWETFDPTSTLATSPFALPGGHPSRCHGWGTGVLATLIRRVAGIEPGEPGYSAVTLKPALDTTMPSFSMAFRLTSGKARFGITQTRDKSITLTYLLPSKVPVDFVVPEKLVKSVAINKKPIYSKTTPVVIPSGVSVRTTGDYVAVKLTTDRLDATIKMQAY